MSNKIIDAAAAAALVHDGDTITTSGFVGIGVPDALLAALGEQFAETGAPRDLTLLFAAGQGDGKERGLNRLAAKGLLKRVVGGHWGLIPKVAALAMADEIEAYNLPQGVISQLYRAVAAKSPGHLSRAGLETFVDPRNDGGKLNNTTKEDLVTLTEANGETCLLYKTFPIHVALLRGTTADERGNVTMEHEALILDNLAQAMAAKNSGGVVIVQVERVAQTGSLNPREVQLPAALVDAVVVAPPDLHEQTYATQYSPAFAQRIRAPEGALPPMPLTPRKVIARRAAFELPVNGVVNLGIGMPEGVAAVAGEEGLLSHLTLTAEPGVIGGQPASGLDFGAAVNTDAVVPQNAQFDFYDGGGLDLTCLGLAEADARGNVNVSRFGPKLAGAGGFINISQNARFVVFSGTFCAGGFRAEIEDGALNILSEGKACKFIDAVGHVTFSGERAGRLGQPVLYVTERCVFELRKDGLALIEIAPGVDLEKDVLSLMAFRPILDEVALMDERIFQPEPMDLRTDLLHLDIEDRIALGPRQRTLYLNFEKMRVRWQEDVALIKAQVEKVCGPLDHRVDVIANYDGAKIDDEVAESYAAMVAGLTERFYDRVTRYSGSAFMRMKLGQSLGRDRPDHVFESVDEARGFLDRTRDDA